MTIKPHEAYQPRKTTYIYLDDIYFADFKGTPRGLLKEAEEASQTKIFCHFDNWRMWGKQPIREAYENKTHNWIIWPFQTSNKQKWAVGVINVNQKKAVLHSASQAAEGKLELVELANLLSDLTDFKVIKTGAFTNWNPTLDIDNSTDEKQERESIYLTMWYVGEILRKIKEKSYNYEIDAGKAKLKEYETAYNAIQKEAKELPTIKDLEDNQEKHTEKDLKPKTLPDDWEQQLRDSQKLAENSKMSKDKINRLESDLNDEKIANELLLKTIREIISLDRTRKREYEVIDDPDAAFNKIGEILNDLKKEWSEHLENNHESLLLRLALNNEEKKTKAKEILKKVKNIAETMEDYKALEQFWNNDKTEYDDTDDYDGKLYQIRELLEKAETTKEKHQKTDQFQFNYAKGTKATKKEKKK